MHLAEWVTARDGDGQKEQRVSEANLHLEYRLKGARTVLVELVLFGRLRRSGVGQLVFKTNWRQAKCQNAPPLFQSPADPSALRATRLVIQGQLT